MRFWIALVNVSKPTSDLREKWQISVKKISCAFVSDGNGVY